MRPEFVVDLFWENTHIHVKFIVHYGRKVFDMQIETAMYYEELCEFILWRPKFNQLS